jgi:GDPmannose 4,6-dehydratase
MSALHHWGHARDYVEMQLLKLQQDHAEDFVIATGVQCSVRQFVEFALNSCLQWKQFWWACQTCL